MKTIKELVFKEFNLTHLVPREKSLIRSAIEKTTKHVLKSLDEEINDYEDNNIIDAFQKFKSKIQGK